MIFCHALSSSKHQPLYLCPENQTSMMARLKYDAEITARPGMKLCSWIILAPVGIPAISRGHNEISLNFQTFWACALLQEDKCDLKNLLLWGMHADNLVPLSETDAAWRMARPYWQCQLEGVCVFLNIKVGVWFFRRWFWLLPHLEITI